MGSLNVHRLLCLLHIAFILASPPDVACKKIYAPQNMFCLFTTGELVFEERMKRVAPSARPAGVGSFSATSAQLPSNYGDDTIDVQPLYGAIYYISNDDRVKIEELAYNRMILADFEINIVYERADSDLIDCLCMDEGLLPHAFPLPIYTEFPRDLSAQNYVDRLQELGVPMDYRSWLKRKLSTKANDRNVPPAAYIRPPGFVPPPVQPACSELGRGRTPQIQDYEMLENEFCVFATNELVFEEAMKRVAPSATTIGAGMLWDRYIALGGQTVPDQYHQFKGFDKVWGVAYRIDVEDLDTFIRYGVTQSFFSSNVQTIVKAVYQATCMTYDIGLLPSGFPYRVFQTSTLNLEHYLKRLSIVGVPSGYIQAIERLAGLLNAAPAPDDIDKQTH